MDDVMHTSSIRDYRQRCSPRTGEVGYQVVVEQTDLWIISHADLSSAVSAHVSRLRGGLKAYIMAHPEFAHSLTPVAVQEGAEPLVKDMGVAAGRCAVGPMAAVAGAMAEHTARRFVPQSPDLLVENGGDCFIYSTKPRSVGILADPSQNATVGLAFEADDFPLSLCSSSATIGHSLSLGKGELAVVRSPSGAFADAAATALCNMLHSADDLGRAIEQAKAWAEPVPENENMRLDGVFVQCKGRIAVWGAMELTAIE